MTKCKHPPDHVVIKYDCDGLPDPLELSWRECLDCGAWLSLGPSNESDPRIALEIRAAEIAVLSVERKDDAPIAWCSFAEWLGFDGDRHAWGGDVDTGYLARAICEHDKDPQ